MTLGRKSKIAFLTFYTKTNLEEFIKNKEVLIQTPQQKNKEMHISTNKLWINKSEI